MTRTRLWATAAAAPTLAIAVTIAASNTPNYSHWRDTVSRLASPGQPWAEFVRIAFIAYGVLVLLGAEPLARAFRIPLMARGLVVAYAVCAVAAGIEPKDMPGAPHTTASQVHVYATVIGGAAIIGLMILAATSTERRRTRVLSMAAAACTAIAAFIFGQSWGSSYYGAVERIVLVPAMAWLSYIAFDAAARHPTSAPNTRPETETR